MRYIFIGAGAVGGSVGGRLYDSGHEVVLVARGAHHDALRDGGLRLLTPEGRLTLPIPVVDRPEAVELRTDDVLVLAVKTQDSIAALQTWAARPVTGGGTAGERLPLVCAQNGVENERLALRCFRRVYGMCVWLPSHYLEPGTITAPCAPLTGILNIGRFPDNSARAADGSDESSVMDGANASGDTDETAQQMSADLEASRFLAPVVPDVMRWKYAKLLLNLGNALEAVCGPPRDDEAVALLRRARDEGATVLTAAGIAYVGEAEQAALRNKRMDPRSVPGSARAGGSSWQSLTRGTGSIEADYLNGEIVLLGRVHGVPTPVNAALQRMANLFAREGRPPGTLSAAELAAEAR